MTQTIQKMEEKLKGLAKENLEMVGAQSRARVTRVFLLFSDHRLMLWSRFSVGVVAEGEDQLSSAAEEAQVFE